MAMFQGKSNFAAKRAARHGRTKQYKESLKTSKENDNSINIIDHSHKLHN